MTYLANLKTYAGIRTSAAFLSRYRGNLQEYPLTLKSEVDSPLPGKVEKEREEKTIASEEAEEKRAIDKVDPFLESLEGI